MNVINWSHLGHFVGDLRRDGKELLPVIVELRTKAGPTMKFTAYSFSERDDEIVILASEEELREYAGEKKK